MPAEPDGYDLQRQLERQREDMRADFERVRADLQAANDRSERHVTTDSLVLFLNRLEDRIKDHDGDLVEERTMRRADITAEQDARKDAVKRLEDAIASLTRNLRWIAAVIVLPTIFFIADIVLRGS